MTNTYHSAFIALIGRPNSGKSTLLNTILGEQVSIVTSLPQTTRKNLKGIYTDSEMQLVFIDTPGIHGGKYKLNTAMIDEAERALKEGDVDIVCYVVDLMREFGEEEEKIAGLVSNFTSKRIIIFNKKDRIPDPEAKTREFLEKFPSLQELPSLIVSATAPETGDRFLEAIKPLVPEGPQYFPEEDITDENLRFFAAEYIRRCIIQNTRQEIPHACFVEIESYKEKEQGHFIEATIHVETKGQRGILVGKGGAVISKIRSYAEADLSKLTGVPAYIKCHIKVTPHWRNDKRFLREHGYPVS
ncbi:MAG: GTPase Era [Chitinivibrionales bacterium]|nr:GTPase Era [Chitinivibrionales bacterium]